MHGAGNSEFICAPQNSPRNAGFHSVYQITSFPIFVFINAISFVIAKQQRKRTIANNLYFIILHCPEMIQCDQFLSCRVVRVFQENSNFAKFCLISISAPLPWLVGFHFSLINPLAPTLQDLYNETYLVSIGAFTQSGFRNQMRSSLS